MNSSSSFSCDSNTRLQQQQQQQHHSSSSPNTLGSSDSEKVTQKIEPPPFVSYWNRPARKQVSSVPSRGHGPAAGGTGDYNIWYHKHSGGRENKTQRQHAQTRCSISNDSGWTRGSRRGENRLCLNWIKGGCINGSDCSFRHHLFDDEEIKTLPNTEDVFGRQKFMEERQDMGGVGSFGRDSSTIYVGGIIAPPLPASARQQAAGGSATGTPVRSWDALFDIAYKQFGEWGPVRSINIIPNKACLFVEYFDRRGAEVAKEAMAGQSLVAEEILNVRWSFDDPNPRAQKRVYERRLMAVKRKIDEQERQINSQQEADSEQPQELLPSPSASSAATDPCTRPTKQARVVADNHNSDAVHNDGLEPTEADGLRLTSSGDTTTLPDFQKHAEATDVTTPTNPYPTPTPPPVSLPLPLPFSSPSVLTYGYSPLPPTSTHTRPFQPRTVIPAGINAKRISSVPTPIAAVDTNVNSANSTDALSSLAGYSSESD